MLEATFIILYPNNIKSDNRKKKKKRVTIDHITVFDTLLMAKYMYV